MGESEVEAEVDRIMALSDEALLAEVRANGEDPEGIAEEMRASIRKLMENHNG